LNHGKEMSNVIAIYFPIQTKANCLHLFKVIKLLRYLLTNDFSKRDVQKQLNALLQNRPNKIRSKGTVARARLQLIRECKTEQARQREALKPETDTPPSTALKSDDYESDPSNLAEHFNRCAWHDADSDLRSSGRGSSTSSGRPRSENSGNGEDFEELGHHEGGPPMAIKSEPFLPAQSAEHRSTSVERTKSFSAFSGQTSKSKAISILSRSTSKFASSPRDDESIHSTGKDSNKSALSLRSLKKRLLSKYSPSYLVDIKSLLERLTISERSEMSSERSERTSTKAFSQRYSVPARLEHPVVLPAVFPQYCYEHIHHNELLRCDDIRLPCNRALIFKPIGHDTYRSVGSDVLFKIRSQSVLKDDLSSVDAFRNSILHIAAALGSSPRYLSSLITMGANVNCRNNAYQSFLHVVHLSDETNVDDFRSLIGSLVRRNFNFLAQDYNGQTAIHALTQLPLPANTLSGIIQCFHFYNIELPSSRDNLGYTVTDQLRETGFKLLLPQYKEPRPSEVFRDRCLEQQRSINNGAIEEVLAVPQGVYNHENHNLIENLEDLQQYELHADLLRTILRAGEDPLFEDVDGCNGIHCLAQVRLDLPVPDTDTNQVGSSTEASHSTSSRERYLEQLLLGGVDPNSYDKHGNTPFMAFIIHKRDEEDETLTMKLFDRLFKAGADIHRRNQQGETALHIAVSLGHRAATKFLLSHGANIHARTRNGTGILTHALKHSSRAARDEILYAQISLCICLARSAGAIAAPTILHEWASPEFKIIPDRAPPVSHVSSRWKSNR